MIYKLALVADDMISVRQKQVLGKKVLMRKRTWGQPYHRLSPCLLAVNRQIYQEARPLLYTQNEISLDHDEMSMFLTRIGSAVDYLERIDLEYGCWAPIYYTRAHRNAQLASFAKLAAAKNLRQVSVTVLDCPLPNAGLFFDVAKPWLLSRPESRVHDFDWSTILDVAILSRLRMSNDEVKRARERFLLKLKRAIKKSVEMEADELEQ